MKIYQTSDMEESVKKMAENNHHSVLFNFHWCIRNIKLRYELLSGIQSMLVRSWDSNADNVIKKWEEFGGLMIYRHMRKFNKLPKCEALFFPEMPLTKNDFELLAAQASKEIIIFRPPDWSMHDEAIEFLFPRGSDYKILFDEITSMIGGHDNLCLKQRLALKFSGWEADQCAVFHTDKITCMTAAKMRHILSVRKQIFKNYSRFDPYKPVMEPANSDLMDIYRLIQAQEDAGQGLRFLRFGKAVDDHVQGFEKGLKLLVKSGSVMKYEPIHVFKSGWEKFDYEMIDATSMVRRNSGMRMREILENSPIY